MRLHRIIAAVGIVAVITGTAAVAASASTSEPRPHCTVGTLTENSGQGPTFHHVHFCDFTSSTNYVIVDGSKLQRGAVLFGSTNTAKAPKVAPVTAVNRPVKPLIEYTNPNGTHWHCFDLHPGFVAWNCISGFGYLYGDLWAGINDLYQHPSPDTNLVVGDTYFNPYFANGIPASDPQWYHRVILVNDGALHEVLSTVNWKVLATASNPPAPKTCMVVTGPASQIGKQLPCPALVKKSVISMWDHGSVIPNRVLW